MNEKKQKKLTYALTEDSAIRQITDANQLCDRAKSLLKTYLCEVNELKYEEQVVQTLAEYMSNTRFYADVLERQLLAGDRVKNEKTGEDNIIVPYEDFTLISSYFVVTAACENELEALGISMRVH